MENVMKKACAVIPSYNEQKNIVDVVKGVLDNNIDVLVVDDGSTDNTYQLAKSAGALVIKHPGRQGKGTSIKSGLDWVKKKGYEYIFTIDADGQHNPQEIPTFIKEADSKEDAGVVIGNRLPSAQNMPFTRLLTNKFMSFMISRLCSQEIPDTQCGYKLIKKKVLDTIDLETHKFEIESEILIKAARAGFKISSVPIASIYAREKSKIRPLADALRFFKFLFKSLSKK